MEELEVTRILDDNAKSGVSAKTNKPWSMSKVELSNGEGVYIFNPIAQGEKVVGVQNGEYMNWNKVRPDPKHEEVMKALRELYKLVKELRDGVEPEKPVKTAEKTPERDFTSLGKPKATPEPDVVITDIGDEPINLDSIPF